jgi:DNA-binding protein HU-beta
MTTRLQLVEKVWRRSGGTSGWVSRFDVEGLIELTMAEITATLAAGEDVQLLGFGTFHVKERKARVGSNPQTRQPLAIPAKRVPAFRPGGKLKAAVAQHDAA